MCTEICDGAGAGYALACHRLAHFFFFFFFFWQISKLGRSKFYILIELYFFVENAKIPGLSMSQIKELWVGR